MADNTPHDKFNPKLLLEMVPEALQEKIGVMLIRVRDEPSPVWGVFLVRASDHKVLYECCATTNHDWAKIIAGALGTWILAEIDLQEKVAAAMTAPPPAKRH